ncbi:hypothetical protein J8C06_13195 [Chloracidobacterium validum]|uniref:Uncharacterized protein n=1 Tax=Chloracidobacterium validum TaxID=2821543 RepID=A0ABX8BCS7_9BACT|nr:hypothetical protein [Chloracidobacterium validum]QUW04719.1 hypothetical protein J8C06_13195 [Chloracidobacterium validum]
MPEQNIPPSAPKPPVQIPPGPANSPNQPPSEQFMGSAGVGRINYAPPAYAANPYAAAGTAYAGGTKPWWQKVSRRGWIIGGATAGVVTIGGIAGLVTLFGEKEVDTDSLELQKKNGWNIGSEDRPLNFSVPKTQIDSRNGQAWKTYLDQNTMLTAFEARGKWQPYFVPTLIQSLQAESLRSQLSPILAPSMEASYGRGQALAEDILANASNPGETAIIVDLIGRDSVAYAAGLASHGRLVTLFDNYPHPLGVVPSHETLAAMLYYADEIASKQATLAENAPPVFLLDAYRLNEYKDADNQFDNRYLAKVPPAAKLKEAGIKNIIYVTPDSSRKVEMDDLNEDFVEYKEAGLNVAILPANEFIADPNQTTAAGSRPRYYYGGHPMGGVWFFYAYPFYAPSPVYVSRTPYYRTVTPATNPMAGRVPSYTPTSRPTMFSASRVGGGRGVGRSKPSGFGRSTVRVGSGGRVTGTRAGRSGSFGRGGFGFG